MPSQVHITPDNGWDVIRLQYLENAQTALTHAHGAPHAEQMELHLRSAEVYADMAKSAYPTATAIAPPAPAGTRHCGHWATGDGDCHRCGDSNWCPDEGETPEALADYEARKDSCLETC